MRKLVYGHVVLSALFFLGCGEVLRTESRSYSKSSRSTVDMNSVEEGSLKPQALNLKWGDTDIAGSIDRYGTVTIDYPTELRGDIKLISFQEYESPNNSSFSQEYCRHIAAMVEHGFGTMIRYSYDKYILNFSLPAYVASSLPLRIMEHVKSLGHINSRVKNPVEPALAKIKIFFNDGSLSLANGRIGDLEMALNVGTRGDEVDIFYKHLQLKAGDIVCDLATKKARMEMYYPINGEKKIIKVIFDSQDFFLGNKAP